jgi:hypothetical protein
MRLKYTFQDWTLRCLKVQAIKPGQCMSRTKAAGLKKACHRGPYGHLTQANGGSGFAYPASRIAPQRRVNGKEHVCGCTSRCCFGNGLTEFLDPAAVFFLGWALFSAVVAAESGSKVDPQDAQRTARTCRGDEKTQGYRSTGRSGTGFQAPGPTPPFM